MQSPGRSTGVVHVHVHVQGACTCTRRSRHDSSMQCNAYDGGHECTSKAGGSLATVM